MTSNDQRVAIVTGGSQGIGAGLVAAYRDQGWAVVANARTITPSGDRELLTVEGDITDTATVDNIIGAALEQFVRIDTLVNNTTTLVDYANSKVPSVLASLTKGGVAAATRSLAIEYASRGIRVNAVSPAIVQTAMHSPESYVGLAELIPLGRLGQISDIVDGVLFLKSSPFITGEILHIDGGQIAGH